MNPLHAGCAALLGQGEPPMPWLAPYREVGCAVALDVLAGRSVAQALAAALALHPVALSDRRSLHFVPQGELPQGEAYEAFIARTGRVPTRDNLHDLLNGLVWLAYPAMKLQLNRLHAAEIARRGVGPERGATRDRLTLFDENGALLQAPDVIVDALRRKDWPAAFVQHRALWSSATVRLVGHALLEKLMQPRAAITAHVWTSPNLQQAAQAPQWAWPAGRAHFPMPVLGIPGWWAGNEDPAFYDDRRVFRPPSQPR